MTRREALLRTASGLSAAALSGSGTTRAQGPTESAIPPGVVTRDDFEAAQRKLAPQSFEIISQRSCRNERTCDGTGRLQPHPVASACAGRRLDAGYESDAIRSEAGVSDCLGTGRCPRPPSPARRAGDRARRSQSRSRHGHSFTARPVEEIARVTGPPPWYQLYVTKDRGATREEAQRAENAGCKVLFVTVDTASAGGTQLDDAASL